MTSPENNDSLWMAQALVLAMHGQGLVEPNPMVGCVLVKDGEMVGEGYHQKFGASHAEVNAIITAGENTAGSTAYVTLEPCSHHGKTPPCCDALIAAKVSRVVIASRDPNPKVSGEGIRRLRQAGIQVSEGILEMRSRHILAPYLKLTNTKTPWMIAKWAMTLDGKIATANGSSQWITNEESRAIVHQIRGRVDAIMVGSGTATTDDPMLNARPTGLRVATRVVVDSTAKLSVDSQLCKTAHEFPTLIATRPDFDIENASRLLAAGCEIWTGRETDPNLRLEELLTELGSREMTNVLVEGGGKLFGSLADLDQIDEVHAMIGPKIVGGKNSPTPMAGLGRELMPEALKIDIESVKQLGDDVYIVGRKQASVDFD